MKISPGHRRKGRRWNRRGSKGRVCPVVAQNWLDVLPQASGGGASSLPTSVERLSYQIPSAAPRYEGDVTTEAGREPLATLSVEG